MRPGQVQILDGEPTDVLAYEGIFPGPTIKARVGRPAHVRQRNELGTGRDAVVHLHGGINPHASDGHPEDVIPPGGRVRLPSTRTSSAGRRSCTTSTPTATLPRVCTGA